MPFELQITIGFDDTEIDVSRIVAAHAENPMWVRLPGTSMTGPCAMCIPYFHMRHDGSGREVPEIPLHPNCVCRDIPAAMLELSEPNPRYFGVGGWAQETREGRILTERAIGAVRSGLLRSGAVEFTDLYRRSIAGSVLPLSRLSGRLARRAGVIRTLSRLTRDRGVAIPAAASTSERIDLLFRALRRGA